MKKEWLGWTAGIVDGEGCIYVTKLRNNRQTHALYLWIGNTSKGMLDKLAALWGGKVFLRKSNTGLAPHPRKMWIWCRTGKSAGLLLSAIRPYLVAKAAEADVALDFMSTMTQAGRGTVTAGVVEMREHCYLKLRELKKQI